MSKQDIDILAEVLAERGKQDAKWGANRKHHPFVWLVILGEEVGEAHEAALEAIYGSGHLARCREELIQVAAVACAAIASLDHRMEQDFHSSPDLLAWDIGQEEHS